MTERLRLMNQVVGKTMPEEIYQLTPNELDAVLAGGYQRNLDRLQDAKIISEQAVSPVLLVESSDNPDLDAYLSKRRTAIRSLTDEKLRKKQQAKEKQQQRFGELFIFNKKGGSKS